MIIQVKDQGMLEIVEAILKHPECTQKLKDFILQKIEQKYKPKVLEMKGRKK